MKTAATAWNLANHLSIREDMTAYCKASLGDSARAKGMTQIAREAGLGRESFYTALSSSGNPERGTVLKVGSTLGLQLHASPAVEVETAVKQSHSPGPPPHHSLPTPEITAAR
ncbi:putative addiction module antidote protein [Synechococcus sp. Lug-A]|uniref:addiction module antidote protein n=1 Tax=Synechococcus sp. Lug-A TaxID=2823740 RepID=UPI0020CBCB12|nr:addiction module antidote protein [Synechococcus sp. Lug-A]MCP9845684.1 putative addiction module antidote protein [Synechococcus sp. Lug-A]